MSDLSIINEYGGIYVEPRGTDKGILIYAEFEDVKGMPPNHLALNGTETMKLIKWLVGYLNEISIDQIVGKQEKSE